MGELIEYDEIRSSQNIVTTVNLTDEIIETTSETIHIKTDLDHDDTDDEEENEESYDDIISDVTDYDSDYTYTYEEVTDSEYDE